VTDPEAVRVLAMLAAYFGRPLPQETTALWVASIRGYALEDGLQAVQDLGRSARRMPALAELLTALGDAFQSHASPHPALELPPLAEYPAWAPCDDNLHSETRT
jgi:hypothetical protein